jgi:magnesium and cobalt transporter
LKKKGFLERLLGRVNSNGGNQNEFQSDEREMKLGIEKLADMTAKDVLVPRIDMISVSADTRIAELVEILTDCGHSRVPVYDGTIDNIVGVLYVKDLLRYLVTDEVIDITTIARKPYLIPESKKLNSLLREFQRRRVHIAIVVDEYGGVAGLVALEDIIEEIVGDIQDEYDNEREDVIEIGEGVYLCEARIDLEDLTELFGIEFPPDDFDTLGGFVFDLFGKVPVKFEKAVYEGMDFVIQDMDGHKIKTVKIVTKGQIQKTANDA